MTHPGQHGEWGGNRFLWLTLQFAAAYRAQEPPPGCGGRWERPAGTPYFPGGHPLVSPGAAGYFCRVGGPARPGGGQPQRSPGPALLGCRRRARGYSPLPAVPWSTSSVPTSRAATSSAVLSMGRGSPLPWRPFPYSWPVPSAPRLGLMAGILWGQH